MKLANLKKNVSTALAGIMLVAGVAALSGCSAKKTDYSTWTYDQFASSDIDWNEGVAYQFVMREENNSSTYAAVYPGMMNLREDGSAVLFECSYLAGEPTNTFETLEGYEDNHVMEIFYGYWKEENDTLTVNIKYQNDMDYQVYTVSKGDTMTVPVIMAYPGGDVPVGCEFDCDGTIRYQTWQDYCAYASSEEFFGRLYTPEG